MIDPHSALVPTAPVDPRFKPSPGRRQRIRRIASLLPILGACSLILMAAPEEPQDNAEPSALEVQTLPSASHTAASRTAAGGEAALARMDFGKPNPEAPAELHQFAFLIGHWNCDVDYLNPDLKTRTQGSGTWTAYYALDGWAIMDDFRGAFGPDYIATTFRAFNRVKKEWNGYWLSGQAGIWSQPLIGGPVEGGILLDTKTRVRNQDGEELDLDLKYNFYEIQKDSFRWRQHTSFDSGKSWREETMRIECHRLAGP